MKTSFPFEVVVPAGAKGESSFTVTVRIKLDADTPASDVLHYIRSIHLKNDLMNDWARVNAPNMGLEVKGGPRPAFSVANDRNSPVEAYEQDFKFTRGI